jgi:hypothetical protein
MGTHANNGSADRMPIAIRIDRNSQDNERTVPPKAISTSTPKARLPTPANSPNDAHAIDPGRCLKVRFAATIPSRCRPAPDRQHPPGLSASTCCQGSLRRAISTSPGPTHYVSQQITVDQASSRLPTRGDQTRNYLQGRPAFGNRKPPSRDHPPYPQRARIQGSFGNDWVHAAGTSQIP